MLIPHYLAALQTGEITGEWIGFNTSVGVQAAFSPAFPSNGVVSLISPNS